MQFGQYESGESSRAGSSGRGRSRSCCIRSQCSHTQQRGRQTSSWIERREWIDSTRISWFDSNIEPSPKTRAARLHTHHLDRLQHRAEYRVTSGSTPRAPEDCAAGAAADEFVQLASTSQSRARATGSNSTSQPKASRAVQQQPNLHRGRVRVSRELKSRAAADQVCTGDKYESVVSSRVGQQQRRR